MNHSNTEFVTQCPWCDRILLISNINCGLFICGNDSGSTNSVK